MYGFVFTLSWSYLVLCFCIVKNTPLKWKIFSVGPNGTATPVVSIQWDNSRCCEHSQFFFVQDKGLKTLLHNLVAIDGIVTKMSLEEFKFLPGGGSFHVCECIRTKAGSQCLLSSVIVAEDVNLLTHC